MNQKVMRATARNPHLTFKALILLIGLVSVLMFGAPGTLRAETGPSTVIRIAAMGDIMLGTKNLLPADGGKGSFDAVKEFLAPNDVIFGNYEGCLTDKGRNTKVSKSGRSYSFKTPPEYARWLGEAGFNMVSIANNHILDYGPVGRKRTIEVLAEQGIQYSGPPGTVARLDVKGVRVAMVAFYSGRGSHWLNDIPKAKKIVSGLTSQADIIIVSFHGGAEGRSATRVPKKMEVFLGEQRGDVFKFSRAMIDSGADLVLGHGPHVPRAMEIYRDRLIAYSLGNFCTAKGISVKSISGYAPLLLAELDLEGRCVGGRVVSFIQTFGQHPKLDKQNKAAKLIHELGVKDFPDSNAVDSSGALMPDRG